MLVLARGSWAQRLRLTTALILFAFVLTHLINHAAGLFGLAPLEAGQTLRQVVTRDPVGEIVLWTAALIHVGLGLAKTVRRSTWRMPFWEAAQIASGLAIPLLLTSHVTYSRIAADVFNVADFYRYMLFIIWPGAAWLQISLTIVVWAHAMIGLHHWLRLSTIYQRLQPLALAFAVVVPTAAIAGFIAGGRAARFSVYDDETWAQFKRQYRWPDEAALQQLDTIDHWLFFGAALIVAGVVAVLFGKPLLNRLRPSVPVTYVGGPTVRATLGESLLETSRRFGVPHASVCGGRARCSTCRVLIEAGGDALPPPSTTEAATLRNVGAPENVRLACQLRPQGPITVSRLVPPRTTSLSTAARVAAGDPTVPGEEQGVERSVAVMFLDVRRFTTFSENRLPYDVVHFLNDFFDVVGNAIVANGGWIDKYLGDGLMAVFGRETGTRAGCLEALKAARDIDVALDALNERFAGDLPEPVRVGIGLHVGPVVLGRLGYAESAAVTVIGRTVNTASRLEGLTKDYGVQLVASVALAEKAGLDLTDHQRAETEVRGLSAPVEVVLVPDARRLAFPAERALATAAE